MENHSVDWGVSLGWELVGGLGEKRREKPWIDLDSNCGLGINLVLSNITAWTPQYVLQGPWMIGRRQLRQVGASITNRSFWMASTIISNAVN